jgi:hypothetical protein
MASQSKKTHSHARSPYLALLIDNLTLFQDQLFKFRINHIKVYEINRIDAKLLIKSFL